MKLNVIGTIRRHSPRAARAARLVRAGNVANDEHRWSDAAKAYAAALELVPNRAGVLVQYGHALKEQGFLPEAEAAYLRSVEIDPLVADTHLQIGHVMKLQGDVARAIAAYDAAHRLDPQMTHGRDEVAQLRRFAADLVVVPNYHLQKREEHKTNDIVGQTIESLLQQQRVDKIFLSMFDPFYYRMICSLQDMDVSPPDLLSSMRHYFSVGVEALLPVAQSLAFDADFYCSTYLGGMTFTPVRAYRHWLTTGLQKDAAPNRDVFTSRLFGARSADIDNVDVVRFAARMDPGALQAPWCTLVEGFAARAGDPDRSVAPTAANVAAYVAIAERLEAGEREEVERAFRLRQIVAERVPSHGDNRLQLAQMLRYRGSLAPAAQMFRALEEEGKLSAMLFVGLAACESELGFPYLALETTLRGCREFPGDQGMRWQRFDRAQRLFGEAWEAALAAARSGCLVEGQAEIARACDAICAALKGAYSGGDRPVAPKRAIRRVLLASHAPLEQCRFYRIDQTAAHLEEEGFVVTVLDLSTEARTFHASIHSHDAVVFCRVPALPIVVDAIEAATAFGLTTFYDMDDLIFDPAFPDPIESYGGLVSRDEHAGLALAVPLFDRAMRMCTFGISSTASLAEAMRSRVSSGMVHVRPNALGSEHLLSVETAYGSKTADTGGQVTLFYGSGSKAHKADFERLVAPALVSLVRTYGRKISVVLMGEFPQIDILQPISDYITILQPVWDRQSYWAILAQADINLAVLLPGPAADAKSEIKWLEAAMLGIPSVVSGTATYRAVVRHGDTAMICSTAQEFTAALDRLVRDDAFRRRIGDAARTQAMSAYAESVVAVRLRDFLVQASAADDLRPLIVIAHVFYPPQAVGGATRVVRDNVCDLQERARDRFRIEVFTCLDGGDPYAVTAESYDGVRVNRVGSPDVMDLERQPIDDRMGKIFGDYLDTVKPAMVHFHCIQRLTASIVLATAKRRIPYVVTVHDGWWISEHQFLLDKDGQFQTYDMARPMETLRLQGMRAYLRMVPLRQALFGAKQVLAVSEPFAAVYRACGVPNVIGMENGVPSLPPAVRDHPADDKIWLGFVGGLARHKGFDLIEIAVRARAYKNLALLLIDHALPAGAVRREMWGSVAVEIRPKWPQDHVAKLYGRIHVLLAPSVWPESFGLVTREAAASGCFVIASDRGSVGSFLREGVDGFVIDVTSPAALIAALEKVDADPSRFRTPFANPLTLRPTSAQADELAAVYDLVLASASEGAA